MKQTKTNGQATAQKANKRENTTAEIFNLKTDARVRTERDRETGAPRYAFAYVLYIGGTFHSLVNAGQWDTEDGMQSMKWGVWNGASMFRKTPGVLVYVLCLDGFYRLCSCMNHTGDVLPAFHESRAKRGNEKPRPMTARKSAADITQQAERIIDALGREDGETDDPARRDTLRHRAEQVADTAQRYADHITHHWRDGFSYISNGHYLEPVSREVYMYGQEPTLETSSEITDTADTDTEDTPAEFFTPGTRYRCTKSVKDAFTAGRIYEQATDPTRWHGYFTNDKGISHTWPQPAEIAHACELFNMKPEDTDPRLYFEPVSE